MTDRNTQLVVINDNLNEYEFARALDLLVLTDEERKGFDMMGEFDAMDKIDAEINAHEQEGFYVPTREELIETTGEFFVHLMLERE
jgi:hypothetical protein